MGKLKCYNHEIKFISEQSQRMSWQRDYIFQVIGRLTLTAIVCVVYYTSETAFILPSAAIEVKTTKNTADFYFNRADEHFKAGNFQGAIDDLTEVIRLEPNNAEAYYGRGSARTNMGEREGIEDWKKAVELWKKENDPRAVQLQEMIDAISSDLKNR
ncbi:MAG: tetratricopeptide repeat protein [Gloeocapsa sp. DLM2.Bin57]|nr:MAG: tetratricopeptide repeat protein [Gloeocapsa sp. DLM2.Bin57]